MPRPKLNPSRQQRQLVKQLAAVGVTQEHIARMIGVKSPKTVRLHFRKELDLGQSEANATIASALFKNAKDGNTDAQKFWLMNRAGWGRSTAYTASGTPPPPFIVGES